MRRAPGWVLPPRLTQRGLKPDPFPQWVGLLFGTPLKPRGYDNALAGTLAVVAFSATTSSAAIVCNEMGDCWHAKEKYDYKREFGVQVYHDEWKWADNDHEKCRWREHEGRGYWNPKGVWIGF